ncbi:MAG: HEAT repeat domain-containing protein [Gemmatales bacterium]|nr:HEAT repeat domain-containing protein [Gemmatales bacterium]MDW7993183.1 HEAT repeat domain-containing protein [Gemmatales bacterium]
MSRPWHSTVPSAWILLALLVPLMSCGDQPSRRQADSKSLTQQEGTGSTNAENRQSKNEPSPKAVPLSKWLKLLEDKNLEQRLAALQAISNIGPEARAAVPLLQKLLESPEVEERKEALRALSAIGPAAEQAIPQVRKLLQDSDADVQEWACSTLGRIGESAKVAIPELEKIILNASVADKVRWAAAVALGNIGPAAVSATPTLLKALRDSDPWLRWAATEGLAGIGPQAKGAAAALAEALYDPEYIVRIGAARALVHLAPQVKEEPKVLAALIRCYEDTSQFESVRKKIAEAIREVDPKMAAKLGIR